MTRDDPGPGRDLPPSSGDPAPGLRGGGSQGGGSRLVLVSTFFDDAGATPTGVGTWEWDGNYWSERAAPSLELPITGKLATLGGKVVLFGEGLSGAAACPSLGASFGETWEWDGIAWTRLVAPGPSARSMHAMATLGGKVVLFGGLTKCDGPVADTWEFDGQMWTQRDVTGPSARYTHTMATLNGRIVLFGGFDNQTRSSDEDTWEWDGNTWTLRATSGPAIIADQAMATLDQKIVLFGGNPSAGITWEWDGTAWTQLAVEGPSGRYGPAMAALNQTVVLFGGRDNGGQEVDTWQWDGTAWTSLHVQNAPATSEFAAIATR